MTETNHWWNIDTGYYGIWNDDQAVEREQREMDEIERFVEYLGLQYSEKKRSIDEEREW